MGLSVGRDYPLLPEIGIIKMKTTDERKRIAVVGAGAAGITALFGSPIAGIFFVLEVISKKTNKVFFLTTGIAVTISAVLLFLLDESPLFPIEKMNWNYLCIKISI